VLIPAVCEPFDPEKPPAPETVPLDSVASEQAVKSSAAATRLVFVKKSARIVDRTFRVNKDQKRFRNSF
jgi:hypothetical protein